MIVIFRPENMRPARKGAAYFNGVRLQPGTNPNISPERLAIAEKSSLYQRCLNEWKAIEVLEIADADPNSGLDADLRLLAIEDAEKVVANTYDLPTLENWKRLEKRTDLINYLQRRITEVSQGRG